ncbi:MAG: hypothetical protein H0X36_04180 [Sphingomonadaceae bacterium]|nr:hypothetical protein [Sphingomonadaceae bacterium]
MAEPFANLDPVLYPTGHQVEAGGSAIAWSAIWGGTVAAIAISLVLLALGSGFGLASVSPWPGVGAKASTFTIGAGLWLIVMQWLSSAVGGYIAGRTRTKWSGLHTDEVFFRDTVHGLIAWSLATIIVAGVAVATTSLASIGAPPVNPSVTPALADEARKAAAMISIFGGLSMLVGAFVASAAAAIGGQLRDKHP